MSEELVNKLNNLMTRFNKKHKTGQLEPVSKYEIPEVIPTGNAELDNKVLVIGGFPRGRASEVAGQTSSGKSTLILRFIAKCIERGLIVVYAENEDTITYEYGEKCGCPRDKYLILPGSGMSGPEYFERILELIEEEVDVIVIDSLNGLSSLESTVAGLEGRNMNTEQSIPKLTADFARKLQSGWVSKKKPGTKDKPNIVKLSDFKTTLIVINHLMTKLDGTGTQESPMGEKIKFMYSIRLFMTRLSTGKNPERDENGDIIYTRTKFKTNKNKLGPPFREATLFIDNRIGDIVSDSKAIADIAVRKGIIESSGAWITWSEDFKNKLNSETSMLMDPALEDIKKELTELGVDLEKSINGSNKFIELLDTAPILHKYVLG